MIRIVTDSNCDLPQEVLQEYKIHVIPLHIHWGSEQYLDRVTMQPEEFYRRVRIDPLRPSTAQLNQAEYAHAFSQLVEEGADEILCVCIGSGFSGCYQAAVEAAQTASVPVQVLDSRGLTMMTGWPTLEAARSAKQGLKLQAVFEAAEKVAHKTQLICGLETLGYALSGGRLGETFKWIGERLPVRGIVSVSTERCKVEPVSLTRTRKSMLQKSLDVFIGKLGRTERLHIAVMHGDAAEDARALADLISEKLNPLELFVSSTGPVLGIHTGPGAIALVGYSES